MFTKIEESMNVMNKMEDKRTTQIELEKSSHVPHNNILINSKPHI